MKKRLFLVSSATTVMLLSGCASEQLQKDIDEVRIIAQEAKSTAQMSMEKAESASASISAAMSKAEAATTAAEAAQACCDDNRERVDRVFRKSMNK